MELPNLEGQPPWVVVIVFALFVGGTLGLVYLKRKGADPETPPPEIEPSDTVALPALVFDPAREAMGHLATIAARSAADADRAEDEAKALARQLADCERKQAVLQTQHDALVAQLAACREHIQLRDQGK